jgi:hypothetical protein
MEHELDTPTARQVPERTTGGADLPQSPVLRLQRLAGNRGTVDLLRQGTPGASVTHNGGVRVSRLAYNDDPTTWPAPNTLNRSRSGEGAEGVYFVNNGVIFQPGTVVVKPVRSHAEVDYASRFLQQGMGFDVPDSMSYDKQSQEGQALAAVLTAPGVQGLKTPTEAQDQVNGAASIMVMSVVLGKSIQKLDDAEGTEFLQNQAALGQVGRLMVSDAFLGNEDRLIGGRVNLGNFFYATAAMTAAAGKVTTIDNDSKFRAVARDAHGAVTGDLQTKMMYVDQLCDVNNRMMWVDAFIDKVKQQYTAGNKVNAVAEITNNRVTIAGWIVAGIVAGLTDIANVFATNMDLVRAVGDDPEVASAQKRQVDEAKATAHYIQTVQGGVNPATAANRLSTYLQYRATRNQFPTGLKWLTKLGLNRGFTT